MSVYDVTFSDDVAATKEAHRQMMAGEAANLRYEKRFLRKDGDQVWADVAVRLVRDAGDKPLYFQTVIIDIRDRKRSEVLQAARFAVTQALLTSPGWDRAAPHVLEGLCETLDWELAEYWEVDLQREAMHFVTSWKRPGRDTSAYEATAKDASFRRGEGLAGQVWESGGPVAVTDVAADGSVRSAAALAAGLKGIVGFPVRSGRRVVGTISLHTWAPRPLDDGLIAVMNDIGSQIGEFVERKRAELALQDSEKRTRSVLDNVSDGLATLDQASVIESANPAVVKLFGYPEEELVGQPVDTLIATTHRSAFVNYLQRRLKLDLPASGAHDTMGKRKNGSLSPSSSSSARCTWARATSSSPPCATSPSAKHTPTRSNTRRSTTRSQVSRTEACSATACARPSSPRGATSGCSACCCSTWIGSRTSTTRSATTVATACCRR
jgi:PAS domain S-box-containing protein